VATAVVHEPALVFLDEPTAHLDPESKRLTGDLLRELAAERTVVLTTHDLREADRLCDRLLLLADARLRAAGTRAELLAAVPADPAREGGAPTIEDAFFHLCGLQIVEGEAQRPAQAGP
jgi:ABC-type multidrug transport system ATPase subunit